MEDLINPRLNNEDRIVLIAMQGETDVSYGDKGTVDRVNKGSSFIQYFINWDNGSTLALLEDLGDRTNTVDKWMKEEDFNRIVKKNRIKESDSERRKNEQDAIVKNRLVFLKFDTKFLFDYLEKLRQSSVVNMFGINEKISPNNYLYLGKERIAHEHKYNNAKDDDAFEELVEMADEAKDKMIQGAMKVLESEGKEISVENVSKVIGQYSKKILLMWMTTHYFR
jgi:hypothetical protein